ncbi:MAG TPA: PQQ-binding-like beta-propeller repeat protein [Bryobacteraceae bacterium]|nr:PQQ-binding-like beta-propeller repeat protein [Bryobacteraceae bacterium]
MRALASLLACSFIVAAAPGWPQFRGPESNPSAQDSQLPDRWSLTDNVEWSTPVPGRGWSSPIVAGNDIFVTAVVTEGASKQPQTGTEYSNEYVAELSKQGLTQAQVLEKVTARDIELPAEVQLHYYLYCLDLKTGSIKWRREFHAGRPPGGRHRKNSFSSETPITDGKHVYVYVANLGLYAFNLRGKPVWKTPLESNPIYLDFGTGSSPVLHGNQLIILSDNEKQQYLASFDRRTGKQLWRTLRNIRETGGGRSQGSAWTTPFLWTNAERTEIVTVGPAAAVSYDLAGRELWRLGGMSATPVPSPFSYDGLLYIDAGRGKPLFAVRPGAKGDISLGRTEKSNQFVAWSDARGGTYLPTPVAYEGGIYALTETGILSRFDAKSGKLSYKSRLAPDAGYFTASPWAYNGKLFCLSEEGKTFVVSAEETFTLLHVNPLDEMAQATPAIVDGRLLIRTESKLYSIRKRQ